MLYGLMKEPDEPGAAAAFEALSDTYSDSAFSFDSAADVIAHELGISHSQARSRLKRLIEAGNVGSV